MITLQSIYPICTDIDNLYISHEGLLLNYEAALTKPQQKVAKLDILESKVQYKVKIVRKFYRFDVCKYNVFSS